jgi:NAD/NADP transhydrogenase beta subunit
MTNDDAGEIGEFLQGEREPASSWLFLVLGFVTTLIFLVLFSILYPGSDLPVISSMLPVFEGVFDSGIWFFIFGVMIGVFAILGTMLTEATSE